MCAPRPRSPAPQRLNNRWNSSPGIESVWSNTSIPLSKSNEDARQSETGAGSSTFVGRSPRAVAGCFSVGSKSTNTPSGKSAVIRHTRRGMVDFFTFTERLPTAGITILRSDRNTLAASTHSCDTPLAAVAGAHESAEHGVRVPSALYVATSNERSDCSLERRRRSGVSYQRRRSGPSHAGSEAVPASFTMPLGRMLT